MSVGLQIDIRSAELDAKIQLLMARLTTRTELNASVGEAAQELTRNHLVAIAQTRHATAERLGATPSGYWAQAAEKTSVRSDEAGATVSINQPGIGRVAHDVTIVPGAGKKYLTLAAIAAAYNQRAYRLDLTPIVRFIDGTRRAVALGKIVGKGKAAVTTIWYWLVKSVRQKQDRTLLPSDEEYRLTALAGVRDYIDLLLR